ncbi:putative entry exclusion protein TrbK-alt [Rhizobium puerariae]|uniref:Entry exclusion protein TrbK-alt n=1 Tax=Rhizobium puerariae TaxID=1585791 RepID=A0ABV6AE31_9HYPH
MDLKIAARMIAVFAIGAGLTAAITALQNDEDRRDVAAPRIEHPGGDRARDRELSRCRDLGTAALEDAACRKAWAENRRRFFRMDSPDRPTSPKANGGDHA